MGGMIDWNDVRYLLAVAEEGSTLKAARRLRVSQTTAARRIAALEAALGVALFERRSDGYALTEAGKALIAPAGAVAEAAALLTDAAAALRREQGGVVRLSVSDIFATTILVPILSELHDRHPEILVEVDASDAIRDLASGEAEIALRVAKQLRGEGMVGRRIGDDLWAIYCSRDYAERHGRPATRAALHGHPFIGGGGAGVWEVYRGWLAANDLTSAVTMQHGSTGGLLAAVRAGAGLAVLPCIVADSEPTLVRCLPPHRDHVRGMWLLVAERLRGVPRVRIVADYLWERLVALRHE